MVFENRKFFFYFCVIWLGLLLGLLIFCASLLLNAKIHTGTWWAWKYGFEIGFCYAFFLLISIISWVYAVGKTIKFMWPFRKLTFNDYLPLVWLIFVPACLVITAKYWVQFLPNLTVLIFRSLN